MISNKELLITACLRCNARETLTKLSKQTKIPISTIFDKLKMHQGSLFKKHTTIVDFAELGYHTKAHITLKVKKDQKEEFKEFAIKDKSVNSAYRVNNGFDFLLEVICKNLKEFEDFVETLDQRFKIESKKTYFLIDDLKKEEFLSDPEQVLCGDVT